MVSDKFTLDSVKGHRIHLSLKSVAYEAGPEKWRTLPGFIFFRITLVKNNDPGRTQNCLNVPF